MSHVSWVGVVSLLCSLLQVVYIGALLWALRARQRLLRKNAARGPPPPVDTELPQHTLTQASYYQNFLPHSFHSVLPQETKVAQNVASGSAPPAEANFSYQIAHTPLNGARGATNSTPLLGTLPPDVGRMSFTPSLASVTSVGRVGDVLYDDEDPFAPSSHRQPSILEEDEQNVVVMPSDERKMANPSVPQSPESDADEMQVSLDGDDATADHVGVLVDSMADGSSPSPARSSRGDIQLHIGSHQTPFSMPHSQEVNSDYSLMADDRPDLRTIRSDPPRVQSRHLVHPKSSSYSRDGGFLQGSLADGMTTSSASTAKRRTSLARRAAAAKLSVGSRPDYNSLSTGVPIPRVTVTAAVLDPNASPVRAKVKFADSPRDRRAAAMLQALQAPQLPGVTEPAKAIDPAEAPAAGQSMTEKPPELRRLPSALKHRDPLPPPPSPPAAEVPAVPSEASSMLVLPIYYRFLVLQLVNCALWSVACVALVLAGTNLVEWDAFGHVDEQGVEAPPSGSKNWLFSLIMALLLAVHSAVLDGLLVFLAAKNVGRASIRFAAFFGFLWALANAAAVVAVIHTVATSRDDHAHHDQLPLWHPFLVRSAAALFLNLFVFLAPSSLVCGARARRTNLCRKSRAERALALQRQQARWEAQSSLGSQSSDEVSEDEFDEEDYDDDTQPRGTWVRLALLNILFHALVLVLYALDFALVDDRADIWEKALMALLAFGFIANTPVLYYCLRADSRHWASEWKNALRRMKEEAEAEEAVRQAARAEAAAKAKAEGRADVALQPNKPSAYAAFTGGSSQHFFLDYSVVEYGALLGSGGFSSVYSAKLWGTVEAAVKVLHVRDMSKEVVDQFLHEVGIVLQLSHPNVVHFLGVVFSPPDMVLVMERCRRQSLLQLIKHRKVRFTEFQAVSVGLAIADALRYIHEQDILHRDLKAANILFDMQGRPKVCDFGLSEERSKIDLNRIFCGTIAYMSPEVLRSETVGKPSDVYSFSIILWELLHNELAWKRGGGNGNGNGRGLNARMLVEMVAYRRARPPVKERLVDDHKFTPAPSAAAATEAPLQALPPDSARIHPQAFAADSAPAAIPTSSQSRPGIHPVLVQLLRECWRDDYRRRPTFHDIVRRLSDFREMIRAHQR